MFITIPKNKASYHKLIHLKLGKNNMGLDLFFILTFAKANVLYRPVHMQYVEHEAN